MAEDIVGKWLWMMDWCKKNLLHPGERLVWEEAERAYEKELINKVPRNLISEEYLILANFNGN